jgi:hypothetical protein
MNEYPIDWHAAAQEMYRSGGGFASALATAFFRADSGNQAKIKGAFADLFKQFSRIAEYKKATA